MMTEAKKIITAEEVCAGRITMHDSITGPSNGMVFSLIMRFCFSSRKSSDVGSRCILLMLFCRGSMQRASISMVMILRPSEG